MKTPQHSLSATMLLLAASVGTMTTATMADTFGTGANAFTLDFVTIGNPGNAADITGFGAVPYTYQMGTYEVSRDMITKANSAGGLGIPLADMSIYGGNVGTHPATGMNWFEAAKFVNWLNTSTGHTAAYNFDGGGNIMLWTPAEAWTLGGENLYLNKHAHYFLPSENEWYKAAYHNGTGYFVYPTGSDSQPGAVASGTEAGTAVYDQPINQGPADVKNAGGLSPYGTMGQGGNAFEWAGSGVLRGGFWGGPVAPLNSSLRDTIDPSGQEWDIGFRVAAVPEPEEYAAAFGVALLGAGVWLRRKKVQGVEVK